jgi:hypothetical protein
LSQLGVPHTQNFEIPLKTYVSENFEISFENFQKCKMVQNLVKDAFWEIYSELFSDLENSKFSLRKS